MTFDDISGNENAVNALSSAIKTGRLSHAYIFEGPSNLRKDEFTRAFISAILCKEKRGTGCGTCATCRKIENGNHEDIFWLQKEENAVRDADVAELQERLKTKPLGERSIGVIEDADRMTLRAQNHLLKTLEEPPQGAVIILLSENIENLIDTIVSRCILVRLTSDAEAAGGGMNGLAVSAAKAFVSGLTVREIWNLLGDVLKNRAAAEQFLDALELYYGEIAVRNDADARLFEKEYIYRQVKEIEEARSNLRRNEIVVSYVMKAFVLKSMQ